MSGDEREGEDEKGLREHFAPVGRSLKRTVTSRSVQAYAVSFVGILVLSASIGGAVVGTYATVQKDFGLCSDPILEVNSPAATEELAAGDAQPNLPHLDYEELTPDERRAFRTANTVPNNEEEIAGNTEHLPEFRTGAVVTYRGAEHYVTISSINECVPAGVFSLPLSIAGVAVGTGLFVAPGLWRRFR